MPSMRPCAAFAALLACFAAATPIAHAQAAGRNVTFRFVPTARAQIAIWLESSDGARFATVRLTDAVSRRGVGNRPGASQMNSGYHWPYGRREGVLPVWAHRRAAAPGAMLFTRVIFQDRRSEGYASRTTDDSTIDPYSCLSFTVETTRRDALDAISCASPFYGDKGRFITATDVAKGYAEPFVDGMTATKRALDLTSLYPPRSDVARCSGAGCLDSADVSQYAGDARRVLPDLDTITMATPPADQPIVIAFEIPATWPDGDYLAYLEINTEGDYNASYNDTLYPTPGGSDWDSWAIGYGYPFRGQPSVVFRAEIHVPARDQTWPYDDAYGYGSLSGVGAQGGAITPIDATISNDAVGAPGSGVDRLRRTPEGYRLRVDVGPTPPDAGTDAASDAAADADDDARAGKDAGDTGQPPLCIPGMTVACACVGGGQGAQTCGSDGKHFEACVCPDNHLAPRNDGCGCDCDVGGSAGGPLGIALLALALVTRRRKHG